MKNLNAFLNPVKVEEKEVVVSKRFMSEGKVVPFVIKPINQKQNEAIIKLYTKIGPGGASLDQIGYMHAVTAAAVVFPDLKDAELQKAYDVIGETETLKAMLLVGEFAVLSEEVQKLSGLNNDLNELIEEAKN